MSNASSMDSLKSHAADDCTKLRQPFASNPDVLLPTDLLEIPNVLTNEEATEIISSLDAGRYGREWVFEGFDRRLRIQRYSSDEDNQQTAEENRSCKSFDGYEPLIENAFGWIFDRIVMKLRSYSDQNSILTKGKPTVPRSHLPLLHRPLELIISEHTISSCRSEVAIFEQNQFCPCQKREQQQRTYSGCSCYIAQVTLLNNATQSIEKPSVREPECWVLADPTENHATDIVMTRNGAIIRSGESLWEWRGRVSHVENGNMNNVDNSNESKPWKFRKNSSSDMRCVVLTFRCIQKPELKKKCSVPNRTEPIPLGDLKLSLPLSKLLTIVVTTSPIRSHPSTEMLERTFETFRYAGEEFAYDCKKVIVCDGCRVIEDNHSSAGGINVANNGRCAISEQGADKPHLMKSKITRKHANIKQALRNGMTTTIQAENYFQFKASLRQICKEATLSDEEENPFRNAEVIELKERHGYGFALRHAIRYYVHTPYVCVVQHDRTFMRRCPILEVVKAMRNDTFQRIKYVGMSMRSNLMYYDIFTSKYGKRASEELRKMILRPKALCISGFSFGPNGSSVKNMSFSSEKLRQNIVSLMESYQGSMQFQAHSEWLKSNECTDKMACQLGHQQLSLTPTIFWYDNTHIAETAHYRDFILNPKYRMVARGGFVEDKLSPAILRTVERLGLREGHTKFGSYLLDDHSGFFFTGHMDGGSYLTADAKDKVQASNRTANNTSLEHTKDCFYAD